MTGFNSPIQSALRAALSNRVLSMVYFALNGAISLKERKAFRREWTERGAYDLGQLLIQCALPDWSSYPETFWVDLWIGEHLRKQGAGNLCYVVEQWLEDVPLPVDVDEDPYVEDRKVRELERLFIALNP
jgi:hypothetical protein